MCGFAGVFSPGRRLDEGFLKRLAQPIRNRGPDDDGIYLDQEAGFGVAHRRLAILDLSPRGHQPMIFTSGRYIISCNGEIYNHLEFRRVLTQWNPELTFRGGSDTETLLAAIECWGVEKTLDQCNGMFAFAVWDRQDRRLCLAREQMGEKHLYVGWIGGAAVFASELKPILPCYPISISPIAVGLMLGLGYVPVPWSIAEGVFKLPPAHLLWLSENDAGTFMNLVSFQALARQYWSVPALTASERAKKWDGLKDPVTELEQLLSDAVQKRMLADVPLGACLSGGIDSSAVVALMQAASGRRVKTFTIGFEEAAFDEAGYAGEVARSLSTDHTEVRLRGTDVLALIPELPKVSDEPFADSSQLPTLLLSQMIKRHVTVALSGDGGDELFYGYDRYPISLRLWSVYGKLPVWFRKRLAQGAEGFASIHYRLWRLLKRLSAPDFDAFYLTVIAPVPDTSLFCKNALALWAVLRKLPIGIEGLEPRMMYRDQTLYLPDDILVKVDRASMSVSLEMRAPFLDHRLVEWAWSLPLSFKYQAGRGKWLLRRLLRKYLPPSLFERPKQGFGIPIDLWLRGPLRDWAEELLSPASLAAYPQLKVDAIRTLWQRHCKAQINVGYGLWNVLMLMAWLKEWRV